MGPESDHGSLPAPIKLEMALALLQKKSSKRHMQPLLLRRSSKADSCVEMRQ